MYRCFKPRVGHVLASGARLRGSGKRSMGPCTSLSRRSRGSGGTRSLVEERRDHLQFFVVFLFRICFFFGGLFSKIEKG